MFQQVDIQGAVSPVPVIEISLAPMEEEVPEPRSPFTPSIQSAPYESDSFRPYHLTPPPTMMSHREMRLPRSPLAEEQPKGLGSEQFQAMLRATRTDCHRHQGRPFQSRTSTMLLGQRLTSGEAHSRT